MKKYVAELIGTFWLVLGGCGSAVFAAFVSVPGGTNTNELGLGFLGVSLAFGLTVLTGAYAFGHISGGHFNPAVSFGLWMGKRFSSADLLPYIIAQVLGATIAGLLIYIILQGSPAAIFEAVFKGGNPLATNGFGAHSPQGFGLVSAAITELVLTFMFLLVILGATDRRAPQGFAPVPIGLALTLIHLISIPITNTSVNPARSTGVALFCGNVELIGQLWLFWIAPIAGAIAAGYVYSNFFEESARNAPTPEAE
ncbi:aquaporin Z [Synechocystis sp. LKSZ1]|uniref:aquaporin Z n=1 Tax=Synechocystis sp. LKSZ1 TaxID=3144951 RepID=UPI00336BF077